MKYFSIDEYRSLYSVRPNVSRVNQDWPRRGETLQFCNSKEMSLRSLYVLPLLGGIVTASHRHFYPADLT